MDIVTSLHQDSIHGVIDPTDTETPCQESQRTCTRNSPCLQQGCMICSTLINHIGNLDVALNSSIAPPTSPTTPDCPQPPINHPILTLIATFLDAIQQNNMVKLTTFDCLYRQSLQSNLDFLLYDRLNLQATHNTALQLLDSHIAASTSLPHLRQTA